MKRTLIFYIYILLPIFLLTACVQRSQNDPEKAVASGKWNPEAPPETEYLGQLIGVWDATQSVRNRDGTWAENKSKAEWKWYYILNGHAIQDDWISPPLNDTSSNSPRSFGTNIRIYNSKEKQWEMAWIDSQRRKLATFKAVYEDGKIIMNGRNAGGQTVRNTFYNIANDSFDWKQEWTMDKGKTWFDVSRIHCERRE